MIPYVLVGLAVVAVLAVVGYFVARFMKGRLRLELVRDSVDSGEALGGRVTVEAKRPIHGILKVSLVGREERRRRRHGNDRDTTEWVEVYRQDRILEETRDFPSGYTKTYAFEIVAPTSTEARRGGGALRAAGEKAGGVLGTVMHMAAGAADLLQGRIRWHVEARLDAEGVDLYTRQKAHVNLRD